MVVIKSIVLIPEPYTTLDTQLAMEAEAARLVGASFGHTMLHTIGGVYSQQAEICLGNVFSSLAAKVKASTDNMKCVMLDSNA